MFIRPNRKSPKNLIMIALKFALLLFLGFSMGKAEDREGKLVVRENMMGAWHGVGERATKKRRVEFPCVIPVGHKVPFNGMISSKYTCVRLRLPLFPDWLALRSSPSH